MKFERLLLLAFAGLFLMGAVRGDSPGVIQYGKVTVSSLTPTAIPCATGQNAVNIQNRGPNSIYIGDAKVATTTGTEIISGAQLAIDITCNVDGSSKIYALAATADQVDPANTRYLGIR